jgi:hypothetical protein
MKASRWLVLASLFASLGLARAAAADVCVEVDTQRDNLSPADRSAAQTMLAHAFEDAGQKVVASGCAATYRVYNVQLGASVTAVLSGPNGTRTMKVRAIEEIPDAYSQMVRSLLSGKPLTTDSDALTRNNVTTEQAVQTRAEADKVWFIRLGYGATRGDDGLMGGPSFGFGLRYELDRIAVEPSFLNFVILKTPNGDYDGFSAEYVRLRVLYFFDPLANSTLYLGAGVAWGGARVPVTNVPTTGYSSSYGYSGSGLDLTAGFGYEMLRASTIRLFAEADATAPLYNLKLDGDTSHTLYAPSFALSLGIGWGGHPVVTVRNVD